MKESAIPYGVKDFKQMRLEGMYYVDKTAYIRELERCARFPFFVRPRRFGKTLFCEMLRCYYDVAEKENFAKLFGGLDIGKNPTEEANKYFVLLFDFSVVNSYEEGATWQKCFYSYIDDELDEFIDAHRKWLEDEPAVMNRHLNGKPLTKFNAICAAAKRKGLKVYVIVDEYDNFTNEIVSTLGKKTYKEITHGTGFYRGWFKQLKRRCDRVFMTGVSPVTMDDLTSGYNIGTNISQNALYNAMVGFTEDETRKLFEDFRGCGKFTGEIEPHLETVKAWYDGYCFSEEKVSREHMYNCDMALYYLHNLVETGNPPKNLVDINIRSDWKKLNAILAVQRRAETFDGVLPLTEELADKGEAAFELVESFPIEKVCEEANFKSLYHYYGIVTMGRMFQGELYFRVPNECVRRQIFEYMRGEYAKNSNAVDVTEFAKLFNAMAWRGEWESLFKYLAKKYFENGSVRDGIDGEARINGYLRAYLTMKNGYVVKPEMSHPLGFSDYAMFPDRMQPEAYVPVHSYIIEVKYSKAGAKKAEVDAKHREALEQLAKYAADPQVEQLAAGSPVHYLVYEFKGRKMVRLEEVSEAELAKIAVDAESCERRDTQSP